MLTARAFSRFSARSMFLVLAFLIGVFGTTIAGRIQNVFFFSWPIALAIVFECLVCQLKSADENVKPNPILARITLLALIVVSLAYFWLCRRLSLAFQWSFLIGFPAALPFLWIVKRSVQSDAAYSIWQWLLSALAFSAFYWAGAGVILWVYGV